MRTSLKTHGSFTPILNSDLRTISGKSNVLKTKEHNKKCLQSGKWGSWFKNTEIFNKAIHHPCQRCKPPESATFQNDLSPEGSDGKSHY